MLVMRCERKGDIHGKLMWLPRKRVRTHLEAGVSHGDTYLLFTATLQGKMKGSQYMQNRRQLERKVLRQLSVASFVSKDGVSEQLPTGSIFHPLMPSLRTGLKPLKGTHCRVYMQVINDIWFSAVHKNLLSK